MSKTSIPRTKISKNDGFRKKYRSNLIAAFSICIHIYIYLEFCFLHKIDLITKDWEKIARITLSPEYHQPPPDYFRISSHIDRIEHGKINLNRITIVTFVTMFTFCKLVKLVLTWSIMIRMNIAERFRLKRQDEKKYVHCNVHCNCIR